MSDQDDHVTKATADAGQPSATAPEPRDAAADVRVTVIPAHSPVGETAKPDQGGPRFYVCDYGRDSSGSWDGRPVKVSSFEYGVKAHVYARELREAGHYVRVIPPHSGSGNKRKQRKLNDRLGGRRD